MRLNRERPVAVVNHLEAIERAFHLALEGGQSLRAVGRNGRNLCQKNAALQTDLEVGGGGDESTIGKANLKPSNGGAGLKLRINCKNAISEPAAGS